MVDAVGVEPTMLYSGGFTVHWGYQFSYTSMCFMAEAQGFEPWEPFGSLVFKTSALSHSAKLPNLNPASYTCVFFSMTV